MMIRNKQDKCVIESYDDEEQDTISVKITLHLGDITRHSGDITLVLGDITRYSCDITSGDLIVNLMTLSSCFRSLHLSPLLKRTWVLI